MIATADSGNIYVYFWSSIKTQNNRKLEVIHKTSARIDLLFEECIEMFESTLLGGSGLITAVLLGGFVFKYDRGLEWNFRVFFKHVLKMSLSQIVMLS